MKKEYKKLVNKKDALLKSSEKSPWNKLGQHKDRSLGIVACGIGYNYVMENLADDLEFYHDQGGVTNSKEEFMEVMKKGICGESNTTKSRRELVPNSLDVYPLYSNGALYGALQNGEHQFYESYNSQPEVSGSIAKFSHLWLKEGDNWMLKRVISFDHKMPKSK